MAYANDISTITVTQQSRYELNWEQVQKRKTRKVKQTEMKFMPFILFSYHFGGKEGKKWLGDPFPQISIF